MSKTTSIVLALSLSAAACAGVVVAARLGWLHKPGRQDDSKHAGHDHCRHDLHADDCPFCTPTLIAAGGQCGEHGVPEALCTRCNPKLIPAFKIENDWCAGHNVPESQCAICNPGLDKPAAAPAQSSAAESSSIQLVSFSAPPHSQRAPSITCTKANNAIHFQTPEVAAQAGLETVVVQRRPITKLVRCNAELAFNGDRLAHVSPRAPGVIESVKAQLGDHVKAGQALAVINSAELGDAKAEYLQSLALMTLWKTNFERQRDLTENGVISQREYQETQTKFSETTISVARAAQRLRNLGLVDQQIEEVSKDNETSSLLQVIAPFDGVIVDRHAVAGEVVDLEHALFSIADLNTLWAMLDLNEADDSALVIGQSVTMTPTGMFGNTCAGKLTWISPQVDPHTRTLKARADIDNMDGHLKANMFGLASIAVADRQEILVIPRDAVQWDGCCNLVFVKKSEMEFQPRKVRLGYEVDDWFAVEDGLQPDETIVTAGSFLLKTEILKGSIGAGCCEAHPGKK